MIRIISATEANRTLSHILNEVHYKKESFEIKRGSKIIAKIVPVEDEKKGMSADELNYLCSHLPKLEKDDAVLFERMIKEIRSQAKIGESSWE
jgi:hypothetical protein